MVALLCRRLGGPGYSFTVHGPEEFDRPDALSLPAKIREARFVVAVSEFGRSQLYRWCGPEPTQREKICVVRCGVDDALLKSEPAPLPAAPRVVCIGRLCEAKGQWLLIEAVARLAERGRALRGRDRRRGTAARGARRAHRAPRTRRTRAAPRRAAGGGGEGADPGRTRARAAEPRRGPARRHHGGVRPGPAGAEHLGGGHPGARRARRLGLARPARKRRSARRCTRPRPHGRRRGARLPRARGRGPGGTPARGARRGGPAGGVIPRRRRGCAARLRPRARPRRRRPARPRAAG